MKWIKYSDKLPPNGENVISGLFGENNSFIQFMDVFFINIWNLKKDDEKASHWHKLEKPPRKNQ